MEEFSGKGIKLFNILDHGLVKEELLKLRKEYNKGWKLFNKEGSYIFKDWRGNVNFTPETLKKISFEDKFKNEVFAPQLKSTLMYYFWSKCEYEIILTSWPPYLTAAQCKEIKEDKEEVKYSKTVNLEVAEKIDVYDQVINNWEPFIDYVWSNLQVADLKM